MAITEWITSIHCCVADAVAASLRCPHSNINIARANSKTVADYGCHLFKEFGKMVLTDGGKANNTHCYSMVFCKLNPSQTAT